VATNKAQGRPQSRYEIPGGGVRGIRVSAEGQIECPGGHLHTAVVVDESLYLAGSATQALLQNPAALILEAGAWSGAAVEEVCVAVDLEGARVLYDCAAAAAQVVATP